MKKSELKTGMLIVNRIGSRGIILLGSPQGDVIASNGGSDDGTWSPLRCFSEDLKYDGIQESDIMEVWSYSSNMHGVDMTNYDRTCLWTRKEVKTTTVKLNKDYSAVIADNDTDIIVGCQKISIDVVREVVKAYEKYYTGK